LLCAVVNEQGAFHELAMVKASESYFAAKIELISLKPFAVYDALFRWPRRAISHRTRSPYTPLSMLRRPAAPLRREWFVYVGGLAQQAGPFHGFALLFTRGHQAGGL